MGEQPRIFVSYSHADTKWLKAFDPHLRGLEQYGNVQRFDDRKLLGGDGWDVTIKEALDKADIVVLLVTANFIGSEYIYKVELPAALKRRQTDGCVFIPVLCETCARAFLGIDDINYLPKDDNGALKPIGKWTKARHADALTQVVEHVHAQIERRRVLAQQDKSVAKATGIDLAFYRRGAQAKWSAIDVSALAAPGALDADVTIRLADVFIPQLARRSRPSVSLPRDWLQAQGLDPEKEADEAERRSAVWERQEPVAALELIAQPEQRLLVLLGDPGAGKSALARYVLLQLLSETPDQASPLTELRGHTPFLIELRDFVGREKDPRCSDLLGYLAFCGRELGFGFDQPAVAHYLSNEPSLLIIDGLDEIFDPQRRRFMAEGIVGLATRYPSLRLLVTSRIAGFDDHPFRSAEFANATLIDLTKEQIEQFSRAWFGIVFRGDPDATSRANDDLTETLARRPQLMAIAGNPMILTIMATVARHKRLGRSRAALYAQALELLCYNWDYKRGLKLPADSPLIDLQPDDTLLMLRRIAWRMQESADGLRANAIAEADLRAELENFFETEWRFEPPKASRAGGEMLERLQVRNWVLTLRGAGLYGFIHRTFLEYLCALELVERFKAQQLDIATLISRHVTPRLGNDSWHEVLRLLVGSLSTAAAAEQVLLAIAPDEVVEQTTRFTLAWQCLADVEPRHIPSLQRFCPRITDLLYSWMASISSTYSRLYAISEIQLAASTIGKVVWPGYKPPDRPWPEPDDQGISYSFNLSLMTTLGRTVWNCDQATASMLRTRAIDDPNASSRRTALQSLAQHFRDDPQTRELLRHRAIDDPDEGCRQTALQSLAQHFRDAPQTRELLRHRAIDDPDGRCRRTALQSLAQHFRDDPQTRELLRHRAIDDPDEGCRQTALQSLAEHFRDDPQTRELLRHRAIDDPDGRCRQTALQSLAEHFRDDPQTRELLRHRAIDDPDGGCRGTALQSLAQHFRDDPQTRELLRHRAIDDPDGGCRRTALQSLAEHFRDDPQTRELLRHRAIDDPDGGCRGTALQSLAQHFRDDPQTRELLRHRAIDDPDGGCRGTALQSLAEHFRDDPQTRELLRHRAIDDPDEAARRAAFVGLSHYLDIPHAAILASQDLDGFHPGRDPHEPITAEVVAAAANKLKKPEERILALFRRLGEEVLLTFAAELTPRLQALDAAGGNASGSPAG